MVTPFKFQFKFSRKFSFKNSLAVGMALIFLVLPGFSWAQTPAASTTTNRNVKRSVATVLFSTIGGAALGLSTLSFYGEPQEHTDNITVGALLGLIAGATYVAYDSAKPTAKPSDYYGVFDQDQKSRRALAYNSKALPLVQFDFSF